MPELGFKKLSLENWLKPEDFPSLWVQVSHEDGSTKSMSCEDWLEEILVPKLENYIPKEIHALFEVARGAIAYGCFFYPLYTLGTEQLFRILETAVKIKCKELAVPSTVKTYYKRLLFLVESKIITEAEMEVWQMARKFRNSVSHPDDQMMLMPNQAVGILRRVSEDINMLFRIS